MSRTYIYFTVAAVMWVYAIVWVDWPVIPLILTAIPVKEAK